MKKRIRMYWLLLLTLVYTASFLLAIGQTQCRFDNTVSGQTRVESRKTGVFSNCLVTAEDAPMTVLVGELSLNAPTIVTFWLESAGDYSVGKLRWGVSEQDKHCAQYLRISMQSGADVIDPNADVDLLKDVRMELTMMIMPTEIARNTEHGEEKINVVVTWGNEMWGTFQVILPEVKAESDVEETLPEETRPEDHEDPENIGTNEDPQTKEDTTDNTEETQPSEETQGADKEDTQSDSPTLTIPLENETNPGDNEGNGQPETESGEDTQPKASDPTEPSEPAETTPTEPSEPAETTPTEPSEPVETTLTEPSEPTETTPTEPSEPAETTPTEPSEPTETTEVTEPTEPEETTEPTEPEEPEEYQDPYRLETLSSFDPRGQVPVKLAVPKYATAVQFGRGQPEETGEENENLLPVPATESQEEVLKQRVFPQYTRFSLDNGQSYYMLYNNHVLQFDVRDYAGEEIPLLLDFSMTELDSLNDMILLMDVYSYGALIASRDATLSPDAQKHFRTAVFTDKQVEKLLRPLTTEQPASEEEQIQTVDIVIQTDDNSILNQDKSLVMAMPIDWVDADLTYTVELLSLSELKTLVYRPVTLEEESLSVQYIKDGDKEMHYLIVQIGEKLPTAGTYRINLEWKYDGICFAQEQTTFFINYSAQSEKTLGS